MMAKAAGSRGAAAIWLGGLVCGAVVALATPYAVLAGAALAPGVLVLLLEGAPGGPWARPVLTIGVATLVQPALSLWAAGHQMAAALALAGDPHGLAASWAWQGLGWLLLEIGPPLIRLALDGTARARATRLLADRARIEAEWGIPPRPPEE